MNVTLNEAENVKICARNSEQLQTTAMENVYIDFNNSWYNKSGVFKQNDTELRAD